MSTSAPPTSGPAPVPFRALPIGARFRFLSETTSGPGYGGARGPWRKLSARKYARDDGTPALVCGVGTVRVECVPILPPTPDEVLGALFTLTEWAVGSNRDGNPYCHPPVKAALRVLSLAFGGSGDWAEGLEVARRARNLPAD